MRAALHNLGCKVNSYETESMMEQLRGSGYEIVEFTDYADVYIINTCSVTNIADRKSRQMLHRPKKINPNAIVIAAGCYVQAVGEELLNDDTVDILVGNNQKTKLVALINDFFANNSNNIALLDISKENEFEETPINGNDENVRVNIKVQDGCNQFCSYCIIPYTRGRVRSRKVSEIVSEAKKIAELGYKEIVITGINLSSYGTDFENETSSLSSMLEELCHIDGINRIRLGSLEPRVIDEKFVEILLKNDKICKHFHLSLQSGCDATLKRMNRHYTTSEYYEKCELLRANFENPAITTDVIVGFPGETDEEYMETYKFIEKIKFSNIHVFKYSKRNGTKAANYPDQVDESKKNVRSESLIRLNDTLAKKYRESFIGKKVEVLLEENVVIDNTEYYIGHTSEYVKVAVCKNCPKSFVENTEETAKNNNIFINNILELSVKSILNNEILLAEI